MGRKLRNMGPTLHHMGRKLRHMGRQLRHMGRKLRHMGRKLRPPDAPRRGAGHMKDGPVEVEHDVARGGFQNVGGDLPRSVDEHVSGGQHRRATDL